MPVSGVHQGTMEALRYAKLLSDDVTAVHVSIDDAETAKVQKKWKTWGEGTRLVILDSPFRLFIEPLLEYIEGSWFIGRQMKRLPLWFRNSCRQNAGTMHCTCAPQMSFVRSCYPNTELS
jgi:hypothetical protein